MLDHHCLSPYLAKNLPVSRKRTLAARHHRLFWHRLFDHLPVLEKRLAERKHSIFEEFCEFCCQEKVSRNWRWPNIFYTWLTRHYPQFIDLEVIKELCFAAARLSLGDIRQNRPVLVTTSHFYPRAYLVQRRKRIAERDKVILIKCSEKIVFEKAGLTVLTLDKE